MALQVSLEFLQHEDVTRQFFVTHFHGCATLFNKHTFEQDVEVKAIRIHHWTEHTAMVGHFRPSFPELDFGELAETANRIPR